MATFPMLSDVALDVICRALSDAATHKELSTIFSECGIEEKGPSGFSVGNGMISGERTSLKCKTKNYTNRYLA
jgi:hypothetical protein